MDSVYLGLGLLAVGYVVGTIAERRHYSSIQRREAELVAIPVTTDKGLPCEPHEVEAVALVSGSAVISVDYFKRFLAWLRNIFGGRVKAYETLLDRARREALLRMREQTRDADAIVNVRVQTSSISKASRKNSVNCVEAVAYGTALRLRKE